MTKLLLLCSITFLTLGCDNNRPRSTKNDSESVKNEKVEQPTTSNEEDDQPAVEYQPEQIEKAKELIAAASEKDIAAVDAKKTFKTYCAICHGYNGDQKINGAKDLTKSKISLVESVAQVYHGRGMMTPFKGVLTDVEIVAVSKYVEREFR